MSVIKFLGATVYEFSAVGGNSPQSSDVQIKLVEDLTDGDIFTSGTLGHPYSFSAGSFNFQGLLKAVDKSVSADGKPTYEVRLSNPYELLEGTQVILDSNIARTSGLANLLNVFGYWEDKFGYGGALINDSGMVWDAENLFVSLDTSGNIVYTSSGNYGVKQGIYDLQNGLNSNFGSSIKYRGHSYKLDLAQLSGIPTYYRFGLLGNASVADLLGQLCSDAGSDYYPTIQISGANGPHTIKINRVSYTSAPPLGKIEEYVNANAGTIISAQIGREMRNDETSLYLAGDNVLTLMQQEDPDAIAPFWGFDSQGVPFIGSGTFGVNYSVTVDATEIADIIGSTAYTVDENELRFALSEYDPWAGYIQYKNPTLAATIGLASSFSVGDIPGFTPVFAHDFVAQNKDAADLFDSATTSNTFSNNAQRVYNFVKNLAQQNYGRRFIVRTPIPIYLKQEPESLRFVNSYEPTDNAYVEPGAIPLGLNSINQLYFTNELNQFCPVIRYDSPVSGDGSSLTDANGLIQGSDVYAQAQYLNQYGVFYIGGLSHVALEVAIPNAYYEIAPDSLGGISNFGGAVGVDLSTAATYRNSSIAGRMHPRAFKPSAAALPMKSNQNCYGPWLIAGPSGKTRYEQRTDLNPWTYGGFAVMGYVGQAYLSGFVTQAQELDYGSVTFPGTPFHSLSEALNTNGPLISDITMRRSGQGYQTSYQFKNFTARRASAGREQYKRFERLGRQTAIASRYIRQSFLNNALQQNFLGAAKYKFMENMSRAVRGQTPHGVLVAHSVQIGSNSYINLASTQTFEESVANSHSLSPSIFQTTSIMSLDGLVRPFSVRTAGVSGISHYEAVTTGVASNAVTAGSLNPFTSGTDFEWFARGNTAYSGLHARKNLSTYDTDIFTARPLSLRAPLVLTGWGTDEAGLPIPNRSGDVSIQNRGNTYPSGYGRNSPTWKSGPVDLSYCTFRKVWFSKGAIYGGTLLGSVAQNATQDLLIKVNSTTFQDRLRVRNMHNVTIASGKYCQAGWSPLQHEWVLVSSDC